MQDHGIERVCCLLDGKLDRYDGLLREYEESFGPQAVCHAPVEDRALISEDRFYGQVLPFLRSAVADEERVVVHCSAGVGRTGHVLVGWLVAGRGYSLDDAVDAVRPERNPFEAGDEHDLHDLFCNPDTPRAEIDTAARFCGTGASPGLASGPLRHLDFDRGSDRTAPRGVTDDELDAISDGDVIVIPEFLPSMYPVLERVAGVITYDAPLSLTSKGAVSAREHEIPAVVDCTPAISELEDGTVVTVDGYYGRIYRNSI